MTGSDRVQYHTSPETIPHEHRHHYESIDESRGGVRGPFSVLLNSPELAGRIAHVGAYIRFEGELPDADRELAILTTARTFDCAYEWAVHAPIAREVGVPEATIEALKDSKPTEAFDESAAIIVRYARELFRDHSVSDETFDAAISRFGESGITELTGTFGYYAMLACVLNAFEVRPGETGPQLD